jgi:alkylated DNA repair dioxygenase AlkB
VEKELSLNPLVLFNNILDTGPWIDRDSEVMKIRGKAFHSTKFFLIADDSNDNMGRPAHYPKYSYPGFQWESFNNYKTLSYMPVIQNVVQTFNNHITYSNNYESTPTPTPEGTTQILEGSMKYDENMVKINHLLGTKYCSSEDNIAYHDDKAKYLIKDSPIFLISMGERRELHLRPKGSDNSTLYLIMEPGSLFVLGPKTNATMQHSIVPTADEKIIERPYEDVGIRISLTFRMVSYMIERDEVLKQIDKSKEKKEKSRIKVAEQKKKRAEEKKKKAEEKKNLKTIKVEEKDALKPRQKTSKRKRDQE